MMKLDTTKRGQLIAAALLQNQIGFDHQKG
jgi:hypothetical protein